MRKYQLDYNKSLEVYENCKPYIEFKHCYNNVFNVVTDYIATFRSSEWKVAYGYVEVMAKIYVRHCFIIDENNNAIDPTICTNTDPNINREYRAMRIFDNVDDYLSAVESENCYPALDKFLKENTIQAQQWAAENGCVICG